MEPLTNQEGRNVHSHQVSTTTFLLKGAQYQLQQGGWYMIELNAELPDSQWGTAHLRVENQDLVNEFNFKLTSSVTGKRFFYISFRPKKCSLTIASSTIHSRVSSLQIFRVTKKFAEKRARQKIIKKNPKYQGWSYRQLLQALTELAEKENHSISAVLSKIYDHTIFPPLYGRENNLKSFLDLGTPLATGKFYGEANRFNGKVTVALHVYYPDMLDEIFEYIQNIPVNFKLIISTDTHDKKVVISNFLKKAKLTKILTADTIVCENRGRNIAPLFVDLAPLLNDSDFILHIHSKKSPYGNETEGWFRHCMTHLLDSPVYILSVLEILQTSNTGVIYPPPPPSIREHLHWDNMRPEARRFLKRIKLEPDIIEQFPLEFPAGAMFWFSKNALQPLLDANLSKDEFESEAGQRNGTLAHIIERLILYIAAEQGHGFKAVRPRHKNAYSLPITSSFPPHDQYPSPSSQSPLLLFLFLIIGK